MAITRLRTMGSVGFNSVEENANKGSSVLRLNMFKKKDLYPMFLKAGSHVRGFILPGFDINIEDDAARAASVIPYRNMELVDPTTNTLAFTNWVGFASGYVYYGKNGSTFLSPENDMQKDPIQMLRNYVRDLRFSDPTRFAQLEYLLKKGNNKEDRVYLPACSTLAFMNVWSANPNEKAKDANVVTNRVLVLKNTAFKHLQTTLNEFRPGSVEPRDPNWDMFLRGDVTNPANALEWGITTQLSSNGLSTNVLDFGSIAMVPGGKMSFTGKSASLPQEAILGRHDLGDLTNVLHISTAEEIINLIVEEGVIPYELICDICGDLVDVMPAKKANTTYSTPSPTPAQPSYQQPAYQQPVYQQPQQPVYQQPQQPVYQQPVYQQPVYQQPQQPAYQQPVAPASAAPVTSAPAYQPAYQQPAAPTNSIFAEDPNDDIPYGDAAPAPAPAPAPAATKLTPEETAKLAELTQALQRGDNLSVEAFKELQMLMTKAKG